MQVAATGLRRVQYINTAEVHYFSGNCLRISEKQTATTPEGTIERIKVIRESVRFWLIANVLMPANTE